MTRGIVYSTSMVAFVAATTMTFAAINIPDWITWTVDGSTGLSYTKTIGLSRSCSSTSDTCQPFPQYEDCHGTDRYFCSMWKTLSFMMWIAAMMELATLVGFVIVIVGGKQKRERGWVILPGLLLIVALLQCASMSIVAYLFEHDDRFFVGWKLDKSWIFCTVSWCISMLTAVFIFLSPFILPSEGGYESIPSERIRG